MGTHVANELLSSLATPESPWLGLHAFTEDAQSYFFGRAAELEDLYERVLDRPLTVLFAQSGLGKSSLLQAALTPRLRGAGLLPVLVRFDHAPTAPSLERQLLDGLGEALAAAGDQDRRRFAALSGAGVPPADSAAAAAPQPAEGAAETAAPPAIGPPWRG